MLQKKNPAFALCLMSKTAWRGCLFFSAIQLGRTWVDHSRQNNHVLEIEGQLAIHSQQ